jgi:phenylacetate-CoA ligase
MDNLRALVKHAYETVPYYNRVFKVNCITPDDIRQTTDLTKIPVLTKRDIMKNKTELVSTAIKKERLIPYMSGGTGDQITFYVTKDQLSWELAAEYRAYGWAGYHLGDKCQMFWGSSVDMAKHEALTKKVTSWLERVRVVNTYIISDQVMEGYLDMLREFSPEVIKGYASSVFMFAKYLDEKSINDIRPRTILTSAEMLFPHYRDMIEQVFGCKVYDYYGSREIGAMAAECEEHNGFHISAENVAMEFLRDGEQVSEESGLIYVTNLRNYGMPFIRYEIGDVGKPSLESCSCGRGLPMIESLEGRASQFMAVRDKDTGKIIPVSTAAPGIIGNLLMYVPVNSYRIVQESLEKIVIQVVAGEEYSQKDTDFLVNHLNEYLRGRITVEVNKVDYLPPLPSGKRSVFISKINAFHTE